jgi:hypothetical protein
MHRIGAGFGSIVHRYQVSSMASPRTRVAS